MGAESYYHEFEMRSVEKISDIEGSDRDLYEKLRQKALEENVDRPLWGAQKLWWYEKTYSYIGSLEASIVETKKHLEGRSARRSGPLSDHDKETEEWWQDRLRDQQKQYDREIKRIKERASDIQELFVDFFKYFSTIREMASILKDDEDAQLTLAFYLGELRDMFDDRETDIIFGDSLDSLDLKDVIEKIEGGYVPTAFLVRILKRHVEAFERKKAIAELKYEEVRRDFFQRIQEGIRDGWLPDKFSRAEERARFSKIEVVDKLEDPSFVSGDHSSNGMIGLYSDQFLEERKDSLRSTIMHELLHEISGRVYEFTILDVKRDHEILGESRRTHHLVSDRKTGIQHRNDQGKASYTWLNEAITEWVSLKLSSYSNGRPTSDFSYRGSAAYVDERKELDRLFDLGLTEKEVLDAYMEDNPTGDGNSGSVDKFQDLVRKINEIEKDESAFQKLENKFLFRKITRKFPYQLVGLKKESDAKLLQQNQVYVFEMTYGNDREAWKENFALAADAIGYSEVLEELNKIKKDAEGNFNFTSRYAS